MTNWLQSLAKAELTQRAAARESLIPFTEYTLPGYATAPHHRLIAEKLEDVASGRVARLMIFMPPRHGKSELASKRFPAWYVGKYPRQQLIAASYNTDLATDFGREVRNIVASQEYQNVFRTVLAPDNRSANRWQTDKGGVYTAAGVGGGITGRGAHVLLIDDPFKDRQEADSETTRQSVWDWYTSTAYTRLMPGGAVVLIQTRWHEDDLAGRLLEAQEKGEGDIWEVLSLPAVNDDGQALWPEWYDAIRLHEIKRVIGPRDWSALYQQKPTPDEGIYFRAEWLKPISRLPNKDDLRVFGASDYAVTEDGGDYTVHIVVGLDHNDEMYLLDVWRKQTTSDVWVEAFCDLVLKWKPLFWAEESGQINAGVGPYLVRTMRKRHALVVRRQFPSRHDKSVRARSIQARMSVYGLHVIEDRDWYTDFRTELLKFPTATHDDQVDAFGLCGQLLDIAVAPRDKVELEPKRPAAVSNIGLGDRVDVGITFNEYRDSIKRHREQLDG